MALNTIHTAFEALLEQIEDVVNDLNESGSRAFRNGDYHHARELIDDVEQVADFRNRLLPLQSEIPDFPDPRSEEDQPERRPPTGQRTPESVFRMPILESLAGEDEPLETERIYELLENKMADRLNDYDRQPLPSFPERLRWHNTAIWCKRGLIREGLLQASEHINEWSLSKKGRSVVDKGQVNGKKSAEDNPEADKDDPAANKPEHRETLKRLQ